MQSNKTCPIVEQYLAYLITIKGHSKNTILEYRLDLLQFFRFVARCRDVEYPDFQFANIEYIRSIQLGDMYAFLAYCQDILHSSPGTRARKIVSIRQFWKYLKTKVHLIDNNIAEELETPKQPKRISCHFFKFYLGHPNTPFFFVVLFAAISVNVKPNISVSIFSNSLVLSLAPLLK